MSPIFPLPLIPTSTPYRHHLFPRPLRIVEIWTLWILLLIPLNFYQDVSLIVWLRVYAVLISMAPLLFLGNCKSFFFFEFGNYRSLHILVVSAWVIRSDTKTWIINLFHSFDYRDWFKHAHQLNWSNLIRAFQIKTAGHLYTFFKIAKISNNETTASGQDVENRNSHSLVVAIQNYIATQKTV